MDAKQMVMQMLNSNPMIKSNPLIQNALQMAQKGDSRGLKQLAENLSNEKGISLEEVKNKLGI